MCKILGLTAALFVASCTNYVSETKVYFPPKLDGIELQVSPSTTKGDTYKEGQFLSELSFVFMEGSIYVRDSN